ncbi:hypothetical protein E5288_WYG001684 [Bos mutus]|uniref:Uncharacterized protein n=1 Tax=Bos mutus TaxID=72004 RepID=A0A6B0RNA1_9CETA|nr:hypothetical protein [Bos mutus]
MAEAAGVCRIHCVIPHLTHSQQHETLPKTFKNIEKSPSPPHTRLNSKTTHSFTWWYSEQRKLQTPKSVIPAYEPKPELHLCPFCPPDLCSQKFHMQQVLCSPPPWIFTCLYAEDPVQPGDLCLEDQQQQAAGGSAWIEEVEGQEGEGARPLFGKTEKSTVEAFPRPPQRQPVISGGGVPGVGPQ